MKLPKTTLRPLVGLVIVAFLGIFVFFNYNLSSSPKADLIPGATAVTSPCISSNYTGGAHIVLAAATPTPTAPTSPCGGGGGGTCNSDQVLPNVVNSQVNDGTAAGKAAVSSLDAQVKALGASTYSYLTGSQFTSAFDQWVAGGGSGSFSDFVNSQISQFNSSANSLLQGIINGSADSVSNALFRKDYARLGLNWQGSGSNSGSFSGNGSYSGSYNYDATKLKFGGSMKVSYNFSAFSKTLTGNASYDCSISDGTGFGSITAAGKLTGSITFTSTKYGSVTLNIPDLTKPKSLSLTWCIIGASCKTGASPTATSTSGE